ncbi:MAG: hypothetical protein RIS70_3110 [Planctomycetota bacterium]|jgi:hypothetical protein
MSNWEIVIFALAGYLAVMSFVRLLQSHRRVVLAELQQQVANEQRQKELSRKQGEAESKEQKAA